MTWPAIKKARKELLSVSQPFPLSENVLHRSTMPVREITNDSLNGELTTAGDKLVMVDFFATWFE